MPGLPGHQAPVKATTQGSEKRKKDTDSKEVGGPTALHHLQYNMVIQCDMNSQLGQVVWAKNTFCDIFISVLWPVLNVIISPQSK